VASVATVTATNDYNKQLQFRALQAESDKRIEVRVKRGGEIAFVNSVEVVVGDIISLETGAIIAADGVLLRSTDLQVNESALTGESDDIVKHEVTSPIILSGAQVRLWREGGLSRAGRAATRHAGAGRARHWGVRRHCGGRAQRAGPDHRGLWRGGVRHAPAGARTPRRPSEYPLQESDTSPLPRAGEARRDRDQGRLRRHDRGRDDVHRAHDHQGRGGVAAQSRDWASWTIGAFIYAVTIIVVAIPEVRAPQGGQGSLAAATPPSSPQGLPLAVTVSLAYSTRKMLEDQNLIRHLAACETMGSATDICTDKTGAPARARACVVRGPAHAPLPSAQAR